MAIPSGYTKIEANKLYENVEYYIDTSVTPSSFTSNIEDVPYLNYGDTLDGKIVSIAWDIEPFENFIALSNSNNTWKSSIVNGVHPDYSTLNINLTTSPDWLYVKTAPDYSKVKTIEVTAEDGTKLSFNVGIQEVATEAEMTALLTSGTVGTIVKYAGETGTYKNGELYIIEVAE